MFNIVNATQRLMVEQNNDTERTARDNHKNRCRLSDGCGLAAFVNASICQRTVYVLQWGSMALLSDDVESTLVPSILAAWFLATVNTKTKTIICLSKPNVININVKCLLAC